MWTIPIIGGLVAILANHLGMSPEESVGWAIFAAIYVFAREYEKLHRDSPKVESKIGDKESNVPSSDMGSEDLHSLKNCIGDALNVERTREYNVCQECYIWTAICRKMQPVAPVFGQGRTPEEAVRKYLIAAGSYLKHVKNRGSKNK